MAGSASVSPDSTAAAPAADEPGLRGPRTAGTIRESDWAFESEPGRLIETSHYRVFTTLSSRRTLDVIPVFVERALEHYRSALAALPEPDKTFETFIFGRRDQWQSQTRRIMQDRADLYLNLGRGGYSTRGTAVLYDLGLSDTLSILAHEGWHQYTQIAFRQPLPTWLEEGVATYMEGRRRGRQNEFTFDPWSNRQRYETLRQAVRRNRLIPLEELVNRSPQEFLERDDSGLLTYYAQVWALVLFLAEGEQGRYRTALAQVLEDAAAGRIASRVATATSLSPGARRRPNASQNGYVIARVYFNDDWAAFEEQYSLFVRRIAEYGRRGATLAAALAD
jgi:hypothetical protein